MRGAVAALAVALLVRPAPAAPESPYGPVPDSIDALGGTAAEEAAAERAVWAVTSTDVETARQAARDLVAAGGAGVRRAAQRLASGGVDPSAEALLLQVVSASDSAGVDALLARAAERPRFELRALAVHARAGPSACSCSTRPATGGWATRGR
jgi:hypothetical protein